MGLFYGFQASIDEYLILLILAILFHLLAVISMIILAFADPGIIPKIHGAYEHKEFKHLPIPEDYLDGSIGEM